VPASAAVPLPLSLKVTPLGREPLQVIVGVGTPVAVTVNDPAAPATNVVLFALVIAGALCTMSVKFCVASGRTPLLAVKVRG